MEVSLVSRLRLGNTSLVPRKEVKIDLFGRIGMCTKDLSVFSFSQLVGGVLYV